MSFCALRYRQIFCARRIYDSGLANILIQKGLKLISVFKLSHTHKDKKKKVLSSQESSK